MRVTRGGREPGAGREAAGSPSLVDVDETTFAGLPCCGIKTASHPGREEKRRWLCSNAKLGLRARQLVAPDGTPAGYIEYVPGESAWRGVDAAGYLFIHCLCNFSQRHRGKGWGRLLLESCVADAARQGRHGVAAVVRKGPWMADGRLFLANGFEVADSAPPDYQLLVRKLNSSAPGPAFQRDWDSRAARYARGLTIIRSGQCPHIAKFAGDIAAAAEQEYGLEVSVVDLRSPADAQGAPTPYAVFAVIRNGRVIADHPISRTRFRNIMKKSS